MNGVGRFRVAAAIVTLAGIMTVQSAGAGPCAFYPFVKKWGTTGSGPGAFASPSGVAVGAGGAVFVADTDNSRIQAFGAGGTFLRQWPALAGPTGIGADSTGNIFVSDAQVEAFDQTGAPLPTVSVGSFAGAGGLAVDSHGNVFASDSLDVIWKFDDHGNALTTWGGSGSGNGQFNGASGVAVDSADHVFVVDSRNRRVQEFDNDGTFVRAWSTLVFSGFPHGFCPSGIAIDSDDDVFVTITCGLDIEFVDARIEKFDHQGTLLAELGSYGSQDGALLQPRAVAVNAAGEVFVADTGNDRVQKFGCGVATCGDGTVDPTESCDDGNTANDDGCSASCTVEAGWSCSVGSPSVCTPFCGDGIVTANEECDDGNGVDTDYCRNDCTFNVCGDGAPCTDPATCGVIGPTFLEQCDDAANDETPESCCTSSCTLQVSNLPCAVGKCTGESDMCLVPAYVAIGDSTTTGFSVPTCTQDRATSPFGCIGAPVATPYPERVAIGAPQFVPVYRLGIWGYTIHEAVVAADQGHNDKGPWEPQLLAASKATGLVTLSLGANDMQFSEVAFWLKECVAVELTNPNACADAAMNRAESLRPDIQAMMNRLDVAQQNGARVVVVLYYNPYNDQRDAGPLGILSRDCGILHNIGEIIVGSLNNVLQEEADLRGFTTVDLRPAFNTHGAGSDNSYVFGSDCDAVGAINLNVDVDLGWPPSVDFGGAVSEIKKRFDPHPNDKGTMAQANEILKVVQ